MRLNERSFLSLIFIFSLFLRIAVIFIYQHPAFLKNEFALPVGDQPEYHGLALGIKDTGRYELKGVPYTARPPLYPLFLSPVYLLSKDNLLAARMVQVFLTAIIPIFIYYIAKRSFSRKTAILSSLLGTVYPFALYYHLYIVSESLYAFMLAFSLFIFSFYLFRKKPLFLYLGSFIFGGCALTRPEAGPAFLFVLIWIIILARKFQKRKAMIITFSCVFYFMLALSPWIIRNYLLFRRFIPLSSYNFNSILKLGNAPLWTGVNWAGYDEYVNKMEAQSLSYDEFERDSFETKEMAKFYLKHPLKTGETFIRKFLHFWALYPSPSMLGDSSVKTPYQGKFFIILSLFSYGLMLPFFIFGFFVSWRLRPEVLIFHLIIISTILTGVLTNPDIRTRTHFDTVFIILASYGVIYAIQRLSFFKRETV